MKKIILMVLATIMFNGCNLNPEECVEDLYQEAHDKLHDRFYTAELRDKEIYYGDFGDVGKNYDPKTATLRDLEQVFEETARWMENNIAQKKVASWYKVLTPEKIVPNPEKIIKNGYGSCREFDVLFLNIVYVTTGVKLDICGTYVERAIAKGGIANHAEILYEGQVYNVYTGLRVNSREVLYVYSFDLIFGKSVARYKENN